MASLPNATNITPPRVSFLDPRTGYVSREWYMFFLSLYRLTGSGGNNITLEDVQLGPPSDTDAISLALDVLSNAVGTGPADVAPELDAAIISLQSQLLTQAPVVSQSDVAVLSAAVEALSLAPPPSTDNRVYSGVYTPVLTSVANVTASTSYEAQFMRVGDVVTVSGRIDVQATAGATQTDLGISLPIPSSFTTTEQVGGTGVTPSISLAGAAFADTVNARATFRFNSADTTNRAFRFVFTYRIV